MPLPPKQAIQPAVDWPLRTCVKSEENSTEPADLRVDVRQSDETRRLASTVEDKLRRAVPLTVAMDRFWQLGCRQQGGMPPPTEKDYSRSREVLVYDAFLSHDWWTPSSSKVAALLLLYNSFPAALATLATSILLGVLEAAYGMPNVFGKHLMMLEGHSFLVRRGFWSMVASPIVYWVVLLRWQHICTAFRQRTMVFFDMLCIHQTNTELKQAGILGLGGFLADSKKLVVLWSPRYFTRLWCTFEMASWLRLGREMDTVVVPVSMARFLFALQMACNLIGIFSVIPVHSNVGLALSPAPAFILSILAVHILGRQQLELKQLPLQLSTFSFDNAQSFCCSNNHVSPDTGLPLLCDRRLVAEALQRWYKPSQGAAPSPDLGGEHGPRAAIERFERKVQEDFARHILANLRGGIKYTDVVCTGGVGYIAHFGTSIPRWLDFGLADSIRHIAELVVVTFCILPICVKTITTLVDCSMLVGKRGFFIKCVALNCTFSVLFLANFVPSRYMANSWLQWVVAAAQILLTVVVYRRDLLASAACQRLLLGGAGRRKEAA